MPNLVALYQMVAYLDPGLWAARADLDRLPEVGQNFPGIFMQFLFI